MADTFVLSPFLFDLNDLSFCLLLDCGCPVCFVLLGLLPIDVFRLLFFYARCCYCFRFFHFTQGLVLFLFSRLMNLW